MNESERSQAYPGSVRRGLRLAMAMALLAMPVIADDAPPKIEPKADELLQRSSSFLAAAPFFSVHAEIWQDAVNRAGHRIQAGRTVDLQVRRPNRLHAVVETPRRQHETFYDGKTITFYNRNQNLYGSTNAPGRLDDALDFATDRLGMVLPLEDLLVSDPYKSAVKDVTSGEYIGPVTVLGVPCQHLAFYETNIDWEIWIQDGPVPVPKKILITYNDEEGAPQYTAIFSNWDFQTKLPDFVFHFDPPTGATKVPILEVKTSGRKEEKQ